MAHINRGREQVMCQWCDALSSCIHHVVMSRISVTDPLHNVLDSADKSTFAEGPFKNTSEEGELNKKKLEGHVSMLWRHQICLHPCYYLILVHVPSLIEIPERRFKILNNSGCQTMHPIRLKFKIYIPHDYEIIIVTFHVDWWSGSREIF